MGAGVSASVEERVIVRMFLPGERKAMALKREASRGQVWGGNVLVVPSDDEIVTKSFHGTVVL